MPSTSIIIVLSWVGCLCIGSVASADETIPTADIRQRILQCSRSGDAARLYRSLFQRTAPEELVSLTRDTDTSIALSAYWKLHHVDATGGRARWSARSVERFLGFLEGRAGIQTPKWWQSSFHGSSQSVAAGFTETPFHFSVSGQLLESGEPEYRGMRLKVAESASVKKIEGRVVFTLVDGEAAMPIATFRKFVEGGFYRRVHATLDGENSFLLLDAELPIGFRIGCFNSTTGERRWQTDGWSLGLRSGAGSFDHAVKMSVQNEQVVVFGASLSHVFFEGFNIRTGLPTVRFATNLWE